MTDAEREARRRDLRQAIYAALIVQCLDAESDKATQSASLYADCAAEMALRTWEARDAERIPAPPAATVEPPPRPASCTGVPDDRCALVEEDARMPRGNFEDPHAWECRGCRVRGSGAATLEGAE